MTKTMVSIVIPVYNVEDYLEECLDSLLFQSFADFEVFLVDDGSTDRSGIICDNYAKKDKRIKKVIHKSNSGQADSRNIGMRYATGKYLYFIDSDDFIAKDALKKMVSFAEKSRADIVSFNSGNIVQKECKKLSFDTLRCTREYQLSSGALMCKRMLNNKEFFFGVPLRMFRLDFLKGILLKFCPDNMYEDIHFTTYAYLKASRTIHLNDTLYYRRVRNNSVTRTTVSMKCVRSYYKSILHMMEVRNEYIDDNLRRNVVDSIIEDPVSGLIRCIPYLSAYDKPQGYRYAEKLKSMFSRFDYLNNKKIKLKLGFYRSYCLYTVVKEKLRHYMK